MTIFRLSEDFQNVPRADMKVEASYSVPKEMTSDDHCPQHIPVCI